MNEIKYDNEEVAGAIVTQPTLTAQERRCAQHLMTILPQMRRLLARDSEGVEFPITLQQYAVLKALDEREYLISELADKFKVSRPTMTRIIDGLEGRRKASVAESEHTTNNNSEDKERRPKLVARIESQGDRRLVYAHITAEGRRILRCYHDKVEESAAVMLRSIPPEEMPLIEHVFEVLQNALNTTKV